MAEENNFDLIVIGGGPGGYVAAIRAAQLGMSVACVEKRETLGGTCLNVGCIPSKALLQSSEKFVEARDELGKHGVKVGKVGLDLKAMLDRKDKVVDDLTKGIAFLFKKNKITHIPGTARIDGPGKVTVMSARGKSQGKSFTAGKILIATGSASAPLLGIEIDEKKIVTSTGALSLSKVPGHMVVIGGGVIGLELGSVWRRLGAEVTVVEFLDTILPTVDTELVRHMKRVLDREGFNFRLGTKVTGAAKTKTGVRLTVEPAKGGDAEDIKCDVALVCIGRVPFTEGLGLDEIGVQRDTRGVIEVDARFETSVPGIYAIGDVIPGPMLAHKAEEEGVAAVEMMAGLAGHVNYGAIPSVVYTWPEIAAVGRTEEELKADGINYKSGKFPFSANSRARCNDTADGLVKILADAKTDRVLGAHIIGPDAGTMIGELVLGMEYSAAAEDIAMTCHAHPTLSEAVKEAALAVDGRALHT